MLKIISTWNIFGNRAIFVYASPRMLRHIRDFNQARTKTDNRESDPKVDCEQSLFCSKIRGEK